jgi:hypothetical protein
MDGNGYPMLLIHPKGGCKETGALSDRVRS